MIYLLNGGGSELGFLTSPPTQRWLAKTNARRWLIIPFADKEVARESMWSQMQQHFSHSGFELRSVVYGRDDAIAVEQAIYWAEAVYFPAGSAQLLIERAVELGIVQLLRAAIQSQQLSIIAGGGEGAMVLGQYCIYGDAAADQVVAGLDVVHHTVIDTHLTSQQRLSRLQTVARQYPVTAIGIDDRTAVVIDDSQSIVEVYGNGTVTVLKDGRSIALQANLPLTQPLALG